MKKSILNYLHLTASEYNNNGCHGKNMEVNTTLQDFVKTKIDIQLYIANNKHKDTNKCEGFFL